MKRFLLLTTIIILTIGLLVYNVQPASAVRTRPSAGNTAILTVSNGAGLPGSTGNIVSVGLDNTSTNAVTGVEFWLVYDSTVGITLSQVNVTSRTTNFNSSFTLDTTNPAAVKAHVLMYTLSSASITPGTGSIAQLLFDVSASAAGGGFSPFSFSNANLSDASANSIPVDYSDTGSFTVTPTTTPTVSPKGILTVSNGAGVPGSTGDIVTVGLDNSGTSAVSGVEFWLVYDSTVGITLSQVNTTSRSTNFSTSFTLDTTTPTAVKAHVLLYTVGTASLVPGSGTILNLLFDVNASASTGAVSPLSFSNANLTDASANSVPVDYSDTGTFTLGAPTKATLSVSNGAGVPGSTGDVVTVGLDNTNTNAVSGVEFWLVYNSNIGITLNQVNVTSRTTNFSTSFTLDTSNPFAVIAHVLVYTLSSASIAPASGTILDLLFNVSGSASVAATSPFSFSNANLTDRLG